MFGEQINQEATILENSPAGDCVVDGERVAVLRPMALDKASDELTVADFDWLHWTPPNGMALQEAIFLSLRKVDC